MNRLSNNEIAVGAPFSIARQSQASTYDRISDPSHSWAKVTKKELKVLGIYNQISGYSYQDVKHVYLEEDCDLSLFIKVYKNFNECEPQFNSVYIDSNCFVRELPDFNQSTN